MGNGDLMVLADQVRRGLADQRAVAKDEEFARELVNVHDRSKAARDRIEAALRYRSALRAEHLTVGAIPPPDQAACGTARTTVRKVSSQLLSDPDKHQGLLATPQVEKALAAAERGWKAVVGRANKALEDEQRRLRPADLAEAVPEVPGAALVVAKLKRHQQKLLGQIALPVEHVVHLAPSQETRVLRELREAASEWARLHQELHAGLDEQSESVRSFIKAASGPAGAPLALLTPEVIDWLEEQDATDNFVIRSL